MADESKERSLIEFASELLFQRIGANRAGYGHHVTAEALPDPVIGKEMEYAASLATVAAVHDMLWTSTRAGFGEEHQTASLMGHLASNLSWFAMAGAGQFAEADFERLSTILWAHQSKAAEAGSGVDFGVVAGFTDENNNVYYNVSIFQAKKAKQLVRSEKFSFEINQQIEPRQQDEGTTRNPDDTCFHSLISAAQTDWSAADQSTIEDAEDLLATEMERPAFQMEALLRTQLRGDLLAGSSREWCHYALWPVPRVVPSDNPSGFLKCPVPTPRAVSLRSVIENLNPTMRAPIKGVTVIDVITKVLTDEGPHLCIRVEKAGLRRLVEDAAKLFPDLDFLGSGDDGSRGGLIEAFNAAGLTINPASPSAGGSWRLKSPAPRPSAPTLGR